MIIQEKFSKCCKDFSCGDFMKKFVVKVIAVLLLMAISVSALFGITLLMGPQYSYSYTASLIDKVNRLESIDEPKIILVGNSNIPFGMNSEIIEQKTGYKVVDMGLHGGLGNRVQENMAKFNINKGDIVVACYTSYGYDEIQSTITAYSAVENNLKLYRIFGIKDIIPMVAGFPEYAEKVVRRKISGLGSVEEKGIYSRAAFNDYGDVSASRTQNIIKFKPGDLYIPSIDDKSIDRINNFGKYCEKLGATFMIAGYPIAYGEFSPSKDEYVEFQRELEQKLEYDIISDFTDYFFDYNMFYDTKFHLTTEGADIRAKQLAEDLVNAINKTE